MSTPSTSFVSFRGFFAETLEYLQALAINNNRPWFESHRSEYERWVLEPALNFISAMKPIIEKISQFYTAIPKKTNGSLMRIYRDTRFGMDKTPFKTNIGIHFRHKLAKDVHAPGFYVHLAPEGCFAGLGTWQPPQPALQQIRNFIAEHPAEYKSALQASIGSNGLPVYAGECLKRMPKGFSADHELAEVLKQQHFLLSEDIANEVFFLSDLPIIIGNKFKTASPYMELLCKALNLEFL
jgi:uncharacterized protein (TIGR02453 family)